MSKNETHKEKMERKKRERTFATMQDFTDSDPTLSQATAYQKGHFKTQFEYDTKSKAEISHFTKLYLINFNFRFYETISTLNPAAAEHPVTSIKNAGLSRCHAGIWAV